MKHVEALISESASINTFTHCNFIYIKIIKHSTWSKDKKKLIFWINVVQLHGPCCNWTFLFSGYVFLKVDIVLLILNLYLLTQFWAMWLGSPQYMDSLFNHLLYLFFLYQWLKSSRINLHRIILALYIVICSLQHCKCIIPS